MLETWYNVHNVKELIPIIEGASSSFDYGKPIARHGDRVACGVTLISRENSTAEVMLVAAASCPTNVQTFFHEQYARIEKLAKELNIDADYLMALSSYESGWLNSHNRALNNLFCLTKAGFRNLEFQSLDGCIDFWKKNNGEGVIGSKNMEEFIANLRKMKYNTANEKYFDKARFQVQSATPSTWVLASSKKAS